MDLSKPTKLPGTKQIKYDNTVMAMIIQDLMPLSCVERKGFQEFVSIISAGYVLPSLDVLTTLIDNEYETTKRNLCAFIQTNAVDYVSYTADLWKSQEKEYYLTVHLHFIDPGWKLQHPLIATAHIRGTN